VVAPLAANILHDFCKKIDFFSVVKKVKIGAASMKLSP